MNDTMIAPRLSFGRAAKAAVALLLALVTLLCVFDMDSFAASTPKLSHTSLTIAVGEMRDLTLKNAEGTQKWSSKSKKIATVDSEGTVTGVKTGTTTIKVKYDGETYSCKVTVVKYRVYAKNSTMTEGSTQTLKVKGKTEGKTIKWSSSDTTVLTVNSSGKVTAVGTGTAKIVAKIGSKSYSKKIKVKASSSSSTGSGSSSSKTETASTPSLSIILPSKSDSDCYAVAMILKNNSKKSVKILSQSSMLMDKDYDSFNRLLKLCSLDSNDKLQYHNSITVGSGDSVSCGWAVQGTDTWYDKKSFVCFVIEYEGQEYTVIASNYYGTKVSLYND